MKEVLDPDASTGDSVKAVLKPHSKSWSLEIEEVCRSTFRTGQLVCKQYKFRVTLIQDTM